jgi:hypothetical protein
MKISELVEVLNKFKSEHGDLEVYSKVDWDYVESVEFEVGELFRDGSGVLPDRVVLES